MLWLVVALFMASWLFLAGILVLTIDRARRSEGRLDELENRVDELALRSYPDDDEPGA